MDLDGSYSSVCRNCSASWRKRRRATRISKDVTQNVVWARGDRSFVRLSAVQIDRIVLIGAIEGSSAELIQEMLMEANEALLAGREVIL